MELRMSSQALPGFIRERLLDVFCFLQWFGAARSLRAHEPVASEWFGNELGPVRGDGCLFLLAGGVAFANVKSRQEQSGSQKGAARVGGHGTGPGRIEVPEQ